MMLNKKYFSKNHDRETQVGDVFNKAASHLNSILSGVIAVFFTPTLIASSLMSKEIIIMLANIFLSLGCSVNFLYRLYQNEMSVAEFLVSFFSLTLLITATALVCGAAFTIIMPTTSGSLVIINALNFTNQLASAINVFFLFRDFFVPPCKKALEKVVAWFGVDIGGRYYHKPPLTLKKDRFVIDRLLYSAYKHDSYSQSYTHEELDRLNRLLKKLCDYIEKYDEAFLGYFYNKSTIETIDKYIVQLTTQGASDSSYAFIKKKIRFKSTKLNLLKDAEEALKVAVEKPAEHYSDSMRFFSAAPSASSAEDKRAVLQEGLKKIRDKIGHLENSIGSLESCLPEPY